MDNKKEKHIYFFEEKDETGKLRKFVILKPSRKNKEAGELYYASKLSNFISLGVLPRIVWDKMFKDNGGIISNADKKAYSDLYVDMLNLKNSADKLESKSDLTEDEKSQLEILKIEITNIRKQLQELEFNQINAFENTAEAKARNKTVVWWAATLGAEERDGVLEPILQGEDIEEKLDFYDSEIEHDSFIARIFSRINYLITIWYLGSASTHKEFESFDKDYLERIKLEKETFTIEDKNDTSTESENKDVNQEKSALQAEPVSFEKQ